MGTSGKKTSLHFQKFQVTGLPHDHLLWTPSRCASGAQVPSPFPPLWGSSHLRPPLLAWPPITSIPSPSAKWHFSVILPPKAQQQGKTSVGLVILGHQHHTGTEEGALRKIAWQAGSAFDYLCIQGTAQKSQLLHRFFRTFKWLWAFLDHFFLQVCNKLLTQELCCTTVCLSHLCKGQSLLSFEVLSTGLQVLQSAGLPAHCEPAPAWVCPAPWERSHSAFFSGPSWSTFTFDSQIF